MDICPNRRLLCLSDQVAELVRSLMQQGFYSLRIETVTRSASDRCSNQEETKLTKVKIVINGESEEDVFE